MQNGQNYRNDKQMSFSNQLKRSYYNKIEVIVIRWIVGKHEDNGNNFFIAI